MSIARLIREACARHGERTALVRVDAARPDAVAERIDFTALYERTCGLAHGLADRGLHPGDRIAVLLDNSIDLVLTEWACLCAGTVWVALNARSSAAELSAVVRDSDPALLVYAPGYRRLIDSVAMPGTCEALCSDSEVWRDLAERRTRREPAPPDPSAPVRIRYTSGTSGRPKGAVLTGAAYQASLTAVSQVLAPLGADDTAIHVAPMTHASGALVLPHAAVGAASVLLDRFEPESFVRAAAAHRASAVFLVPTMLVRLLELENLSGLSSLRTIVYGGAAMPVDRIEAALERLGRVLVQIYGLTESTWPVTALLRDEHPLVGEMGTAERRQRLRSCGRPTAVGEVRVVGADGITLQPGEPGELIVRGGNTMAGYWAGPGRALQPSLDAAEPGTSPKGLDADGWMHTGDVAVVGADGFVTILDRLHDMIVSGGFNVYPAEVEQALSSHPAVLESAVVGLPDSEWGERVHAEVVLRPGVQCDLQTLADHCAQTLAGFKKPRGVSFVDALPRNAAGKVLRREVRRRLTGS